MTDPHRHLWASVLTTAIADHRAMLVAAARRDKFASIDGARCMVSSYDTELERARAYFTSADAHRVAALAGTEIRIERIMAYLTDGLTAQAEAA